MQGGYINMLAALILGMMIGGLVGLFIARILHDNE
jgi:hypothetical protein